MRQPVSIPNPSHIHLVSFSHPPSHLQHTTIAIISFLHSTSFTFERGHFRIIYKMCNPSKQADKTQSRKRKALPSKNTTKQMHQAPPVQQSDTDSSLTELS